MAIKKTTGQNPSGKAQKLKAAITTLGLFVVLTAATGKAAFSQTTKADSSLRRLELQRDIKKHGIKKSHYDFIVKAIDDAQKEIDELDEKSKVYKFKVKAIEDNLHKKLAEKFKLTPLQIAKLIEIVEEIKDLINGSNYSDREIDEFWKAVNFVFNDDKTYVPVEMLAVLAQTKGSLLV